MQRLAGSSAPTSDGGVHQPPATPRSRAAAPAAGPRARLDGDATRKVGAAFARRRVLAIVDEQEVTVVALDTGEILSTHLIEPDRRYWRNQRRDPGRWPGSRATG